MSEENNEKKCRKKMLIAGVIVSLVLSIAAMGLSLVTFLGANGYIQSLSMGSDLPISKKYDRGRSLEKALKKDKPVIIWFYVDWCGYCQKFAPVFDEVIKTKEVKKKYAVAFVNCDNKDNQKLIQDYNVMGFPTVFLFNPETGEKKQLDNYKFFIPAAKEEIIRDLKDFVRPKE